MARFRQRRTPSFFWQAFLILLPVAILATVGFLSVRQDRIIAQHDAVERAQTIADSLLPRIWSALTNADHLEAAEHHAFQIDSTGNLLFPPPLSTPAPQPLDPGDLGSEEAALWQQAQRTETTDQDSSSAIEALRTFLATKPPARFAAVATYNLGVLLMKQNQWQAASDTFLPLVDNYPDVLAESGLLLTRLAEFKLLEISTVLTNSLPGNKLISPDYFCERIVFAPSPLTPLFLAWVSEHAAALDFKEGSEKWSSLWQGHEESRNLFSSARSQLLGNAGHSVTAGPRLFWFDSDAQNWLAIRFDEAPTSGAAIFERIVHPHPSNFFSTSQSVARIANKTVALDNEPARIDSSRAKPIVNVSGGTALKNGMSSIEFSGPANEHPAVMTSGWFLCQSESQISQDVARLFNDKEQIPEYFGIGIEIAGKQLREFAPDLRLWREVGFFEGGHRKRRAYFAEIATNILAAATLANAGATQLKVSVYLTSPSTLFKRQRDRTSWFCSLIAAAAVAAVIGLLSAWRAFNRQQELTEMKTNFVSSVSHELRAPIASVRLMAESLERGKIVDLPRQHEYFRFIGQECRRLSSLIENVLDFSRIEQGCKQYEFEPTDLLALVQQTVKFMEPYAAERQTALSLDTSSYQLSTSEHQLSLDARAVQQALINLLDNAIKHSPNGQAVSVTLECSSETTHSGHESQITNHEFPIHISVRDHGPGIPPEEHQKIFERFYRLGSELRRETQGVGIGLSIVKHIVEAHHGRVLVQSVPGQGSDFTIELPLASPPIASSK